MAQITIPPTSYKRIFPVEVQKELRVQEIKKRTGKPFFLAALFIPEMLWTTRINDLDEVLDNYCKYKAGNSTRVFLFPSSWDAKYNRWATDIFVKDKKGKFIMPTPIEAEGKIYGYINPMWEAQVIERIKKVVLRKIMLIISLWDNCSFHYRTPGFWSENFLNPECNNINTDDNSSAYYEYASETSVPTQNTGKIVEAMTRYMLNIIYDSLTPKERKYIAIELCNEGYSGTAWHMRMKNIIDETWGKACPRWRRFTSTEAEISTIIRKHFIQIVHQIGNLDSYQKKIWKSDFIMRGISTDGWHEPEDIPIPLSVAKRLLKRAYIDSHILFETLNGHRQNDIRLPNGINNTTKNKHFYDFSAMRWGDMRRLAKLLMRLTK